MQGVSGIGIDLVQALNTRFSFAQHLLCVKIFLEFFVVHTQIHWKFRKYLSQQENKEHMIRVAGFGLRSEGVPSNLSTARAPSMFCR